MMLWVVGGACRGVGKTWLSHRMAALLPNAVFAKIGHNPRHPKGNPNFFRSPEAFRTFLASLSDREHCVVETNRAEVLDPADIRVFLDAPEDASDVRADADQLRAAADLVVAKDAIPAEWKKTLKDRLSRDLVVRICAILEGQRIHTELDHDGVYRHHRTPAGRVGK